MNDMTKAMAETSDRILKLQQERKDREASANAHEAAAREDRLAMSNCKKEIQMLSDLLNSQRVVQATENTQAAAEKALSEAAAAKTAAAAERDEIAKMREEVAKTLAELKEAKAAPEAPK